MYSELIKVYKNIEKVYIGCSQKNKTTEYSEEYGKLFDGNSILVHIKNNKYTYIGSEIYEFSINDSIIKFYSTIGNNNVPYPVILGQYNVYFMLDKSYLSRKLFPIDMTDTDWSNSYDYYYYGYEDTPPLNIKSKKMKNIKTIHKRVLF